MGEYAEMYLDGTCCQVCGEFMNEEGCGHPVTCEGCGGNEWEKNKSEYIVITQNRGEKQIDYILRLRGLGFVNRQICAMTGLSKGSLQKRLKVYRRSIEATEQ